MAGGELILGTAGSLDEVIEQLTEIPGIGDWTAQYIAMRVYGEPDAFPSGDLALRRAVTSDGTEGVCGLGRGATRLVGRLAAVAGLCGHALVGRLRQAGNRIRVAFTSNQ